MLEAKYKGVTPFSIPAFILSKTRVDTGLDSERTDEQRRPTPYGSGRTPIPGWVFERMYLYL